MESFPPPLDEKRIITRERLRLLALGYKISGVFGALMVSLLIFHFMAFTVVSFLPSSAFDPPASHHSASSPEHPSNDNLSPSKSPPPVPFPGWIFRIVAAFIGLIILTGWTLGGLTFYAGHCLARRQHKTFIQIMAAVNCLWIPYGTLLGVLTFIVLSTREAEAEFPVLTPPPL